MTAPEMFAEPKRKPLTDGGRPDIHFQAEGVAKEPRERMNDDRIDWMVVVASALDHALKLGRLSSMAEAPGSTYSATTRQPWRPQ